MTMNKIHIQIFIFLFLTVIIRRTFGQIPTDYHDIQQPIDYQYLSEFLKTVDRPGFIEITEAGKSIEGRSLFLVHLSHNNRKSNWKLFFYAQQHGNEPAGKDALIYLIKKIADDPDYLPKNVDLWIMPMVNPDGAEKKQRRNANDADLNRDHRLLTQPETRILHQTTRQILPHVALDCHEFTRDSKDYSDRGWEEWPLIMMDCANNPIYPLKLYETGMEWIGRIKLALQKKDINFTRYYVGDLPPENELRHSTLEVDDGRNGIGAYGGFSFIIESGVYRNSANPDADLAKRIHAYLTIFDQFIHCDDRYKDDIEVVENARKSAKPDFIPINYFWGTTPGTTHDVKVVDKESGSIIYLKTANFMNHRVVKNSISVPKAYVIPSNYSELFKPLLERHAIEYYTILDDQFFEVEEVKLIRIEPEFDEVYNRYANRVITNIQPLEQKIIPKGSLLIRFDQKFPWKVALLLEPSMMYSIYTEKSFKEIISNDGIMPVYRVINSK